MARLHHVKKARKDRRKHGIRRGMSYWWWKFRNCPVQFSKTRPRPSRLTRSEFLSAIMEAKECVDDMSCNITYDPDGDAANEFGGVKDGMVNALQSARDVVQMQLDQCSERAGNVEERFPNGCPSLELLRERVDQCERLVEELETAIAGVEAAETVGDVESAVEGITWEVS